MFGEGQDSVTSLPASLALARPPSLVLEHLKSSSLGRDVLLECRVRQPQAQDTSLLWLREEAPVVEGDRLRLVEGQASLGLLISGLTQQDWGRSAQHTEQESQNEQIDSTKNYSFLCSKNAILPPKWKVSSSWVLKMFNFS